MDDKILTPEEAEWQHRTGKKNAQTVINCIFWGIVMDKGGTIEVSCEQVKNLPENMLHVEVNEGNVYITAKEKKEESNLILSRMN